MRSEIEYINLVTGECFRVYEMLHRGEDYYRIVGEYGETIQINMAHVTWIQYQNKKETT